MAVDASIPLQTIAPPIMPPGQQLALRDLSLRMQDDQRQRQIQQAVLQLNQMPGMRSPSGVPTDQYIMKLSQISPQLADATVQHRATLLAQENLAAYRKAEEDREKGKLWHEKKKETLNIALNNYRNKQGSEQDKVSAFNQSLTEQAQEMLNSGEYIKYGKSKEDMEQAMRMHPSISDAEGFVMSAKDLQERADTKEAAGVAAGGTMPIKDVGKGPTDAVTGQPVPESVDPKSGAVVRGIDQTPPTGKEIPADQTDPIDVTAKPEKDTPDSLRVQAKDEEEIAKKLEMLGSKAGNAQAKEHRAKADKLRGEARDLSTRIQSEENATKTPFIKELDELDHLEHIGQGNSTRAKAIRKHLEKMDAPPQYLAQAPTKLTAAQEKLTGDEFLQTLSPDERKLVKGIADLTIDPQSVSMRNNQRQNILEKVTQYRPDYNQQDYKESQAAVTRFGAGKEGQTTRSINVALEHLDTLGKTVRALSNNDVQLLNRAKNEWAKQTGNPAPTNFEAVKQLVADEVVKAIVGTGGSLTDRQEAAKTIAMVNSPQQMAGVIDQYKHLFGGQIHGLEQQYKAATKGRTDFRERYLTDIGRQAAAKADKDTAQKYGSENAPPVVPKAGTVMDGYRFKGGDPSKKENWEKQ